MLADLTEQKILRAVYSERQLQEVLTDFWFNHFNVFAGKSLVRVLRHRPRARRDPPACAWTSFRDLLGATAKSPAMLVYLDNAHERRARHDRAAAASATALAGCRIGHGTGGAQASEASDRDQRELRARAAGVAHARRRWRLHAAGCRQRRARVHGLDDRAACERTRAADFAFEPRLHDDGASSCWATGSQPRRQKEGEDVLDILARHPATARFIATKLVRRFVSDTPPPALVDQVAARFIADRWRSARGDADDPRRRRNSSRRTRTA